nr:EOG090X0BGA [Cyclestheria hislopi]
MLFEKFSAVGPLLLHWYSIDWAFGKTVLTVRILAVHISALFETALSALITLLINNPVGSLTLNSCSVQQLSDWYTLLHNPNPNYEETLHCTHEAVYPLYSIIFIHYGLSVVLLLLIRPWVNMALGVKGRNASRPIYAALYFFPLLSLFHAVMAGLVYYSYPAITILLSLMSHGYHFASRNEQNSRELVRGTVTSIRNLIIVIGHWLLHAYGIIALVIWLKPELLIALLCLVPLPTLLYIVMVRFTDPNKLHVE